MTSSLTVQGSFQLSRPSYLELTEVLLKVAEALVKRNESGRFFGQLGRVPSLENEALLVD